MNVKPYYLAAYAILSVLLLGAITFGNADTQAWARTMLNFSVGVLLGLFLSRRT